MCVVLSGLALVVFCGWVICLPLYRVRGFRSMSDEDITKQNTHKTRKQKQKQKTKRVLWGWKGGGGEGYGSDNECAYYGPGERWKKVLRHDDIAVIFLVDGLNLSVSFFHLVDRKKQQKKRQTEKTTNKEGCEKRKTALQCHTVLYGYVDMGMCSCFVFIKEYKKTKKQNKTATLLESKSTTLVLATCVFPDEKTR